MGNVVKRNIAIEALLVEHDAFILRRFMRGLRRGDCDEDHLSIMMGLHKSVHVLAIETCLILIVN